MSITIREIAARANVSVATVSRVLNNSGYVSKEARDRILQAVEEYGYVPNGNARSLKTNTGRTISLFVKGITNPFFSKMIHIIEEKCALRGYMTLINSVEDHDDEMMMAIREAKSTGLCGAILMGGSFGHTEEEFRRLGIPCLLLTIDAGKEVPCDLFSSVRIDDEKEGFKSAEYLIRLGHRRIGFIYNPSLNVMTTNQLRFLGYQRALKEYGIPFDPRLAADGARTTLHTGYATGFNAIHTLYKNCPDMTGVVCFSDVMALGAMKGIYSMNLTIPGDISVVGFDGIEAGEYYQPSLDTIIQPAEEMALSSVEYLFGMINGGPAQHLVCDGVLAKRGSAGPAKDRV